MCISQSSSWVCGNAVESGSPRSTDCNEASSSFSNVWRHKETFIPSTGSSLDFIKTVHISFHIWNRSDGTGNLTDSPYNRNRLRQIINFVNQHYTYNPAQASPPSYAVGGLTDCRIRVEIDSIYFYNDQTSDSSLYYCPNSSDHNILLDNYLQNNHPAHTGSLNIHLSGGYYTGAGGYSHSGSILSFSRTDPAMDTSEDHDYWFSQHWAHELGHSFDLWHTYNVGWQQNCLTTNSDFLWDVYDTTTTCSTACDVCLLPIGPSNNNLMGGAEANFISNLQMGIMQRSTILENFHNTGYDVRNYVTGYNANPLQITSNQTWDFSVKMYQDVLVKSGNTLTITCEVQFVPEAKIIVEPNAKLIVDGGVLTNEHYYNDRWNGIYVTGNSTASQSLNPTLFGTVILKNGATIEHADGALNNFGLDANGGTDWNTFGGIIQCTDAIFKNNWRSAQFMAYTHKNASGNPINDKSFFKKCNFSIDNDMLNGSHLYAHISQWATRGIAINGCTFSNTETAFKIDPDFFHLSNLA